MQKLWVYLGTYTGPKSKGIYRSQLDLATGKLTPPELATETVNPTFLAIHPNQRFLYAANEIGDYNGTKAGAISSFALDGSSGKLTLLNQQSSGGGGPCHLVVDPTGKCVLAANYGGGSVAALPIGSDGRLAEASAFVQHRGSSVNEKRQKAPHAHSINLDPAGRLAFAADLGLDKLLIYRFDLQRGTLEPHEPEAVAVAPGAGPRHFAFHPSGRYAYVINELNSTITAFRYDAGRGTLIELQSEGTLPVDFKGNNSTAEVQVHPSGKFLYGSNRGHDSLAIFSIDAESGRLTSLGHQSTGGKTPRNFGIDPTGNYVLAANQGTDNVVVLKVDAQHGTLTPTGEEIKVPAPVCVKMLPSP